MAGAAVAIAMLLAACGGSETAAPTPTPTPTTPAPAPTEEKVWEPIEFVFSSVLAPGGLNLGFEWWADRLEERTGGAVTTVRNYSGSLVGASETVIAAGDGTIDIGYTAAAYNPSEFPLYNVVGVPFVTYDPVAQARSLYTLYQDYPLYRAEWERNNVHLILHQPLPHAALGLSSPVSSISGLSGKRLRMVGYVAAALEQLGMETVALSPAELYEAIQRGVVDGYGGWPFDLIPNSKLQEVAPHVYDLGIGHYASAAIVMNLDLWNSLDPDLQALMTELAEEFMFEAAIPLVQDLETISCDAILAANGSVTVFPAAEVEAARATIGDASLARWRNAAVTSGVSEADVDAYRAEWLRRYESFVGQVPYTSGMAACAAR